MYCSSCGGAVLQGLTYCNHCGARLNDARREDLAKSAEITPDSLVWAIVAVFVAGLGTIIGLMAVMKNVLALNMGLIIFFSLLSFLLMSVIETVFILRLLGRIGSAKDVASAHLRGHSTKELGAAPARVLAEPVSSVTDQTTRSFEPIYTERSTK